MTVAPNPQSEPDGRPDAPDGLELLTFRSGGRAFAVDIMAVREIRSWSPPTPLPHAPPFMLGMVNLRGSVLPVMDLSLRLGAEPTDHDPRNVIVVLEQGPRLHGMLVEAVSDIIKPMTDQLQDVPKVATDDDSSMAERLLVVDDVMVQVLTVDRVLPPLTRAAGTEPA